jgi:hypothetical protein
MSLLIAQCLSAIGIVAVVALNRYTDSGSLSFLKIEYAVR